MDDLQRELGRLEETLAQAHGPEAIIDELAVLRRELASGGNRSAVRLPELRVASPCTERWADMGGDDRVRVCDGCERPVFNLSEMTRDQADVVLAGGITPCVRFFRRTDGTVMTADDPTSASARRTRRVAVVAAGTALLGSPALAEPTAPAPDDAPVAATEPAAPDPDNKDATGELAPSDHPRAGEWTMGVIVCPTRPTKRSRIEWSTWVRAGYGVASRAPRFVARTTMTPLLPESSSIGEGALGVDWNVSVARGGDVRLGAWAELRTTSGPVLGGELIVDGLPRHPYGGSGGLVLRGGGNGQVVTAAIGLGYTGVDSWPGFAHRANGVRFLTSMTRGEREWSVTVGVEFDPIGALGFILHLGR